MKPKLFQIWFINQTFGLQGALFLDTGTAWTEKNDFHENWILGGGIGFRLITAAGMALRFDLAIGQPGLKFGFFIGSGEKAVAQRDRVR